jgi:hypothetical protein
MTPSCYNPTITPGQFTCDKPNSCPAGFNCVCGQCVTRPAEAVCDMGARTDGPGGTLGGCSNGPRVPSDPGVERVAACSAAWTVPGLTTVASRTTPCNRRPTANGTSGSIRCTAEDNCATGWHVCNDEAELNARGFTRTQCTALASAPQFFATRQRGGPPIVMNGPPECSQPLDRTIFGCGSQGNQAASSCTILDRVLVDRPDDGTDDCSVATNGAFLCAGTTDSMPEVSVVTKPNIGSGGVLCCQD